eukprot:364496-Chlamydomonas_euryale.AAC.35
MFVSQPCRSALVSLVGQVLPTAGHRWLPWRTTAPTLARREGESGLRNRNGRVGKPMAGWMEKRRARPKRVTCRGGCSTCGQCHRPCARIPPTLHGDRM